MNFPGARRIKLLTITQLRGRPESEVLAVLHDRGVEVRVLAPPHAAYAPLLRARGVAVEPWDSPGLRDIGGLRDLRRSLALFEPDVVVLRGAAVTVPALLASAGSALPLVLYFDLFEGDGLPGFLLRQIASHSRPAGVVCDLALPWQRHLEAAAPITLIPPGHDPSWYPLQPQLTSCGIPDGTFAVGAVAAGSDDDRLQLLIDAARWLPMDLPIHFLLLAPPQDHEMLRRLVRRNPFPQRFHLVDDFGVAPGLMAQCNLFVGLRWDSEPVRRSLLHCLHHGVPCICEDGPLARQIINPGVTGLLIPEQDSDALAHALSGFYERPGQRERLRSEAAREAATRFTMERVIRQTTALLDSVAAGGAG